MKKRFATVVVLALAAAACGGGPSTLHTPTSAGRTFAPKLTAALREESIGDPEKAEGMLLDLIESPPAPEDTWHVPVLLAATDALVLRSVGSFEEVSNDSALAYRTKDAGRRAKKDADPIAERLPRAYKSADGPFARGLVARALEDLAEHRGDVAEAEKWRAARGCAREAAVMGPVAWTSITVDPIGPDPLAAADAPMPATYLTPGAFARKVAPVVSRGHGCDVDLAAASAAPGTREVAVDVEVPKNQTIGVALRSHGTATLRVGGKPVLERPYELGADEVARFARVDVDKGTVRIVARVGQTTDGANVEIDAWNEDGEPLRMHAPRAGERATSSATGVRVVAWPTAVTYEEKTALALAALAAGDDRTAENVVSPDATAALAAGAPAKGPNAAPPELLLAYARALDSAHDLSEVHRAERARGAYERVLEAWPGSWEAILAHAVLAGVRRGRGEARMEALNDLDAHRGKTSASGTALLDAYDAATSAADRLWDRAGLALARASAPEGGLAGSSLLDQVARRAVLRPSDERERLACAAEPPNDRASLDCYDAKNARGDKVGAAREMDRVRQVLGAPGLFLALSLKDALARGDMAAARAAFDAMLPGERTLWGMYALSAATDGAKTADRLRDAAIVARDAPYAIAPLMRSAGSDPAARFSGVAEQVTAADRAHPVMANAATAVLKHVESYDLDAHGVLHWIMLDVRRVNGTTDVEENAQAAPPDVEGRTSFRALRRRIFKKDGRVLEPDRTPNASQAHADLSQLEEGDCVEAIYEGWALPGETGDITLDTPDLLPERTAVADATIELRMPAAIKAAMWSHPLLGPPKEAREGDARVLSWTMKEHGTRRLESATPKMDRNVGVSISTATWDDVARALKETLVGLDEHDPEIGKWARDAGKGKRGSDLVAAVVLAAGEAVREASPSVLSDFGVGLSHDSTGQTTTARTILTDHEGSRTWLIVRALRELGVKTEVAVAESEPFSADPQFPPHFGRFVHPLAVAYVKDANAKDPKAAEQSIWIDADVPGPPLPAGRVSPELRGRALLREDGKIEPVTASTGESARDEIDLRLVVDDKGDAKGSFTILLRGREAQEIAEALVRVVGVERQRALRNVVLAWAPFANVDDVTLSSSEGSWQIALRAQVAIGGYAQAEGKAGKKTWVLPGIDPLHVVFPRASVSTLGATYATQGARQDALAISRAVQYHAHRRVELPAGATPVKMPGPFHVSGPSLDAQRSLSVNGSVLEDDFVLGVSTGTIAAQAYGAFVTNAHRTDDAFLASTRVNAPPTAK